MIKLLTILLVAISTPSLWAQVARSDSPKIRASEVRVIDKVVIIKAISSSKRTFLIKEGFKSGIGLGQTALFSNKHVTISARAIEVSSESSLWEVRDDRSVAPFDKNDIIVFTNNLERRPFEVPELHRLEERIAKVNYEKGETLDAFAVRATDPNETVPEPATMTLLATGLAGFGAARRKRARG